MKFNDIEELVVGLNDNGYVRFRGKTCKQHEFVDSSDVLTIFKMDIYMVVKLGDMTYLCADRILFRPGENPYLRLTDAGNNRITIRSVFKTGL